MELSTGRERDDEMGDEVGEVDRFGGRPGTGLDLAKHLANGKGKHQTDQVPVVPWEDVVAIGGLVRVQGRTRAMRERSRCFQREDSETRARLLHLRLLLILWRGGSIHHRQGCVVGWREEGREGSWAGTDPPVFPRGTDPGRARNPETRKTEGQRNARVSRGWRVAQMINTYASTYMAPADERVWCHGKRPIQNQPVGKNDLPTAYRLASSEHRVKGAATTFYFE